MTNEETTQAKRPRRWWRMIVLPAGIYLGILLMLTTFQRTLIYHPHRVAAVTPETAGLSAAQVHDVQVTADDAVVLHGWFLPGGGRECGDEDDYVRHLQSGRQVALVFCGNAGHRGNRGDILRLFSQLDVDAYVFDYRGYGSNAGSPSETALISDGRTIWRYLTEQRSIAPGRIVIFGESLGGGVATQLAAHICRDGQRPHALVLQATFSSLVDAAGHHYPWLPVGWLMADRFESAEAISDVRCPILHLHGTGDTIVPLRLGRRLFDRAPPESEAGIAKQFVELPGTGHNDIERSLFSAYGKAMTIFLNQIP